MAISARTRKYPRIRGSHADRSPRRAGFGSPKARILRPAHVRWFDPTVGRWLTQDPLGLGPDTNPYRYRGNAPTDGIDPSGMEVQVLCVTTAGDVNDFTFYSFRKAVLAANKALDTFIDEVQELSVQEYDRIRLANKLLIDGKPVKNLTKDEFIAIVKREQASEVVVQTTGKFAGARKELASLAGRFDDGYTYDALAVIVHGNPTLARTADGKPIVARTVNGKIYYRTIPPAQGGGIMDFNGEEVNTADARPVLLQIAASCPVHFVIVSCYNNPQVRTVTPGLHPSHGYFTPEIVGGQFVKTADGKLRFCEIHFETYRFVVGYDSEPSWDWDKTYEKTYVVPQSSYGSHVVPDKPAGVVPDNSSAE